MSEQLLKLPDKPGTVIAIGEWWLVRLRPYENAARGAWELLPMRSDKMREHAEGRGIATQCVYGDEWVLAEAEQEGGYVVISDPRDVPSGVQYFRLELARAAEPGEPRPVWDVAGAPPIGARVKHTVPDLAHMRGEVLPRPARHPITGEETIYTNVHWDGAEADSIAVVRTTNLEPEVPHSTVGEYPWKRGDRVKLWLNNRAGVWHGMVSEQRSVDEVLVRWDHHADAEDVVFARALERDQ